MVDLSQVGAHPSRRPEGVQQVRFGVYLPGIDFSKRYRVRVSIIHEADQFVRGNEPRKFDLWWRGGLFALWNAAVPLVAGASRSGSARRAGTCTATSFCATRS